MKSGNLENRNFWIYSAEQALYTAALPMVNSTLIQVFLASKGMSAEQVGLYNTAIILVSLLTNLGFSVVADQYSDALKQSRRIMLLHCITYLPLLLVGWFSMPLFLVGLATALITGVQTVLSSEKGILEYRIPYQIIRPEQYGPLNSWSGALIGVFSLLVSLVFSWLIDNEVMGNPYLLCMIISQLLLIVAWLCCRKLKSVNNPFGEGQGRVMTKEQVWNLLRAPIFLRFLVPNFLRGITFGIISSLPLIALALGYDESVAAQIPVMSALGYVVVGILFNLLSKWFSVRVAGLIGGALLLVSVLLRGGNETLFLFLVFVIYAGRLLVDYAIPVMIFHIIDPQIAGVYNTWRYILLTISSLLTVYIVGLLVSTQWLWLLLALCAVCYGVSMVWYVVQYHKIKKEG